MNPGRRLLRDTGPNRDRATTNPRRTATPHPSELPGATHLQANHEPTHCPSRAPTPRFRLRLVRCATAADSRAAVDGQTALWHRPAPSGPLEVAETVARRADRRAAVLHGYELDRAYLTPAVGAAACTNGIVQRGWLVTALRRRAAACRRPIRRLLERRRRHGAAGSSPSSGRAAARQQSRGSGIGWIPSSVSLVSSAMMGAVSA